VEPLSLELGELTLTSRKGRRVGWTRKRMSTSDLHLMEVEKLDAQYEEVSKSYVAGVVVAAERAVVDGDDVAAGVADKAGVAVDECLAVGKSMLTAWEATTHTSRLVYMLGRQLKQNLLECQKKD
jgi:hypothetical protein